MSNVFVGKKTTMGKSKAEFFQMRVDNAFFFWSKLHEPQRKYGSKDENDLEYSVKAVVTEDVVEAFEELDINKEPAEIPTTFKDNKAGEKAKKKFGAYQEIAKAAEEEGKTLYLINLGRKAVNSAGKEVTIKIFGRNPSQGQLEEKIGNGSRGSFRIGCIEGQAGTPSEGQFNTYLESVQILDLVEYEEFDDSEESMGDLGFSDMDGEEEYTPKSKRKAAEEEEVDDGKDDFAEFDE